MPITYTVHHGGHFIHAVASGTVTGEEFVAFEVAHAIDERVIAPVAELFEIQYDAMKEITANNVSAVLERRQQIEKLPMPHSCAIVVSYSDAHAWDLANFYAGMVKLHYPENVIVFGESGIARMWLGIDRDDDDSTSTEQR